MVAAKNTIRNQKGALAEKDSQLSSKSAEAKRLSIELGKVRKTVSELKEANVREKRAHKARLDDLEGKLREHREQLIDKDALLHSKLSCYFRFMIFRQQTS